MLKNSKMSFLTLFLCYNITIQNLKDNILNSHMLGKGANMNPIIFWLVIFILFLATEAATMGLTTIWFAGGSLVALILSLMELPFGIQVTVFFVVSFVLLYFTRPLALSYFNKQREKTNIDSIIGSKGIVQKEVNNLKEEGTVSLNGMEWSARSEIQEVIPEGTIVRVKQIQGVKLIVEEVKEKEMC